MARELWFEAPRRVSLREADASRVSSSLSPRSVRARAVASGPSPGTEMLLYRGEGPTPFDPSLDGAREGQEAAPTYPRRYGYAWVGEVVERASDSAHPIGSLVFALVPHGEEHVLADAAARPLPSGVPAARGVLAANLETAVTCVWDARIELGDEVVILGGGVVGLLTGFLAARVARRVRLIEPNDRRREIALELGVHEALAPATEATTTTTTTTTPDARADVVIEATGRPESLDAAVAWAGPEATVVVASFYGAKAAPVALGDRFHRERLTLRSSQVSRIPPKKSARWSYERRFELVSELLGDARLDALLAPAASFDDAARLYADLDAGKIVAPQPVLTYGPYGPRQLGSR